MFINDGEPARMTARRARRKELRIAAALFVFAAAGCLPKGNAIEPVRRPVVLVVSNRGFLDVVIYALPSGSTSATRLATVTGFSKAQLTVGRTLLQPGGVLQLRLHPIGTLVTWTSPALTVADGEQAMLEIYSDANGNLNQTVLYPLPDTTSGPLPQ